MLCCRFFVVSGLALVFVRVILVVVVLLLVIVLFFVLKDDFTNIVNLLSRANILWIFVSLVTVFLYIFFESLGFFDCPGIHIRPDVEQIYQQLRYIVEHKKDIPEWGYKSRKYIEKHHHYVKVAQRYVEAWKTTGKL